MTHIGKFLEHRRNWPLLLKAALLMAAVRVGLSVLPFATLRGILRRLAWRARQVRDAADAARTVWAVETVGRHAKFMGTCLVQALAAHVLLARAGHESNLRIGVTRGSKGAFTAHAWLEREGAILIGGDWARHYVPMPALRGLEP